MWNESLGPRFRMRPAGLLQQHTLWLGRILTTSSTVGPKRGGQTHPPHQEIRPHFHCHTWTVALAPNRLSNRFLRFAYWFEHVWRVVHRLTCRKCAFLSAPSQAAEVFDRRVEATLSFLRSREGRSGRSELAVGLSLLLVQLCGIDCRMTWESFSTNRTVSSGDSKHFCLAIKFNGASVDPHHWEAP